MRRSFERETKGFLRDEKQMENDENSRSHASLALRLMYSKQFCSPNKSWHSREWKKRQKEKFACVPVSAFHHKHVTCYAVLPLLFSFPIFDEDCWICQETHTQHIGLFLRLTNNGNLGNWHHRWNRDGNLWYKSISLVVFVGSPEL